MGARTAGHRGDGYVKRVVRRCEPLSAPYFPLRTTTTQNPIPNAMQMATDSAFGIERSTSCTSEAA